MSLLAGIHHVTLRTADQDRWLAFHTEIFGAPVLFDERHAGGRAVAVATGACCGLEARPEGAGGRLDHIALAAAGRAEFLGLRRALMRAGVTDGTVRDCGQFLSFHYRDPDGRRAELVLVVRPDIPISMPGPVDERQLSSL